MPAPSGPILQMGKRRSGPRSIWLSRCRGRGALGTPAGLWGRPARGAEGSAAAGGTSSPSLRPNLRAGGFLLPSRRSFLTNLSIWGKLSVRNFRSNCPGQNRLFEKGKSRGPARGTMGRWCCCGGGGRAGRTKGGLIGAAAERFALAPLSPRCGAPH